MTLKTHEKSVEPHFLCAFTFLVWIFLSSTLLGEDQLKKHPIKYHWYIFCSARLREINLSSSVAASSLFFNLQREQSRSSGRGLQKVEQTVQINTPEPEK